MSKRPVRIEDLLLFTVPTGVRLGPDGRTAFWSQRSVDTTLGRTVCHLHRAERRIPITGRLMKVSIEHRTQTERSITYEDSGA